MNYQESRLILKKVETAQKILLSCHHHPDSDTVGSATVLSKVFKLMGKETKIICPDEIPQMLQFIDGALDIETHKFEDFNFDEWDLYVVCDTSSWDRLFVHKNAVKPQIPVIVIDNHTSNKGFGVINLLDYQTSSVCEMLHQILVDLNIPIDNSMATALLAGMIGDTGSFQYEVHKNTFDIASKLVKLGADSNDINYQLFDNKSLELIKFWGLVIQKLIVDPSGFAYVAIPFDEYQPYKSLYENRETSASMIIAKVANTKFGFILTEEQPNSCSISFRSRSDVDTAAIAEALGGGGHPAASGAWLQKTSFKEALEKTLQLCRNIL